MPAPASFRPASRTPRSGGVARGLFLVLAAAAFTGCGSTEAPAGEIAARNGPELIALVRHAEREASTGADTPLTPEGEARARELARALADAGITRIHSSDTKRTRDTAAPLAELLGLDIELYDPRELSGMAARLREMPGRHLVVGHSNTTDVLSGELGGATFGELVEAWEYDRLYLLTPRDGGESGFHTVLVRFGAVPNRD